MFDMTAYRIFTSLSMILRMLFRRRIAIILLVVIPVVFLSIVEFTTSERVLPFRLSSLSEKTYVEIVERGISLIFLAVASAGFLVAFLALNLIQRNSEVNMRLVICGYHPVELLISILLSLILMISLIGLYVGLLTSIFFPIDHLASFILGLMLIGYVYGCYGLAVGSVIKGELEGILFIVLLANIDAGWLQNPLFYTGTHNQAIIKFLPAYFPSQTAIIAAFTDYSINKASMYSLLYGTIFLFLSTIIFFNKMHIKKNKSPDPSPSH
jgi:ABC-2 type transport system permease protein